MRKSGDSLSARIHGPEEHCVEVMPCYTLWLNRVNPPQTPLRGRKKQSDRNRKRKYLNDDDDDDNDA